MRPRLALLALAFHVSIVPCAQADVVCPHFQDWASSLKLNDTAPVLLGFVSQAADYGEAEVVQSHGGQQSPTGMVQSASILNLKVLQLVHGSNAIRGHNLKILVGSPCDGCTKTPIGLHKQLDPMYDKTFVLIKLNADEAGWWMKGDLTKLKAISGTKFYYANYCDIFSFKKLDSANNSVRKLQQYN